ncbi:DUF6554 family protein [Synechococcus sp. CS-205]|jgi:hypothetical protein|uniref:DUF6554 family protein n=2 Tax=Cyanophyceae TaxID=3028117 RepID=UPI0037D9ABB4
MPPRPHCPCPTSADIARGRRLRSALRAVLAPALVILSSPLPLLSQPMQLSQIIQPDPSDPGHKGAEVYCFMRKAGNNHEVSWTAAYALIKRQSASLFKTSPEHGAVMITEAVVKSPDAYPDCGQFLGALYGSEKPAPLQTDIPASGTGGPVPLPSGGGTTRHDRYSY